MHTIFIGSWNKATYFGVSAYDRSGSSCVYRPSRILLKHCKENPMAKGQLRGNKEAKKPKKPKQLVVPVGSFITPPKAPAPVKNRH